MAKCLNKLAGYSHRSLSQKLGIKESFVVWIKEAPTSFISKLDPLPENVMFRSKWTSDTDISILFINDYQVLYTTLESLRKKIKFDGIIWVSWYKKSSGKQREVTEDIIREICLPMGLVDVKVCAIDEEWSGLKLVIRKELR